MNGPLWTERHAPAVVDLPQPGVRDRLERAIDEPMNLLVYGPEGSGKTAAVRALARAVHDTEADLIEINVADFFNSTKKKLVKTPDLPRLSTLAGGAVPRRPT